MVGDVDRHDAVRAVFPREHEGRVELPQAVEPLRVEAPGRVEKPDVHDAARRVGEPGVDEAVGPRGVGAETAEQVERERLGGEQVCPQALVIDTLLALDDRIRAWTASSAAVVMKFAPVSRPYSRGTRFPTGLGSTPGRGAYGWDPIG